MLIQFSVKNYKTFKDKATLSLVASGYDKTTREAENVCFNEKFNLRILKSAVVYGANASGKSRLIEAFGFMRNFVRNSFNETQINDEIKVNPFELNSETLLEPSEFELIFIYNKVMYRYGFEVNGFKIIAEWLYFKPKTKEVELFYRENDEIEFHKKLKPKGESIKGFVRNNALFVSTAAKFNEKLSIEVIKGISDIKILFGLSYDRYNRITIKRILNPAKEIDTINSIKYADIGISNIIVEKIDLNNLPKPLPNEFTEYILKQIKEGNEDLLSEVKFVHKMYNKSKTHVGFTHLSLQNDESEGTKKYFALIGPVLEALENGYVLIVDELDSSLHPNLLFKICEMFNSKDKNPKNAQLIFNLQNSHLLSTKIFRRDQIWFTEKNIFGEASLYSLADFKTGEVRKNEAYEDNYIRGKYGAVPYLGLFDSLSIGGKKNER